MTARRLLILPSETSSSHDSAHLHVTGESHYVDDRLPLKNELHVGLVYSPHAKALILSVDATMALLQKGVVCVLTSEDLHHNRWGAIIPEQPIIAEKSVNYVGEVIAVIGAETKDALILAAKNMLVRFKKETPILTIDEAIVKKSFIGTERCIERGDAEHVLKKSAHHLTGTVHLKGADHFYLENQSAYAIPLDDGNIEIHSSTQHPTETQMMVAEALGLSQGSVISVAKRLGGGFGGKETQAAPFAVYAAMVAHKTKRPARIVITKDDDMIITGKRNPYRVDYHVGFSNDGEIVALDVQFFGDGGAYADLSTSILERAMAHVDNAYFLPHVRIRGVVCRTNFHPHTAFRGFGGPKGVAVIEHIMEEIAHKLKIDALDIRKRNCYQADRNRTPYEQVVENNLLPELFATLEERCDYRSRRENLKKWNEIESNNPRGMSLTAIKFGISFTTRFLNQGHALVHIFRDGSVQIATGAVEMGQGVNVRIKSLVAMHFGIPLESVKILPTSTDKSANTSPTAASSGTDLNGSAALVACEVLKNRLAQIFCHLVKRPKELWPQATAALSSLPEIIVSDEPRNDVIFFDGQIFSRDDENIAIDFKELVNAAYLSRVSLSAYGFYKTPSLDFNKITGRGKPFLYFTQGVACSEVEIDQSTGEVKLLRSDILMDLGRPINHAMDRGQITGGFIQGVGWITTENLVYNDDGFLLSHSPSTYKIPSIHDTPRIFNVDLVKNDDNTKNVFATKASGEPPLMLCFSVWNALKDAIASKNKNASRLPQLPVPSTSEVLLKELKPELFKKWSAHSPPATKISDKKIKAF